MKGLTILILIIIIGCFNAVFFAINGFDCSASTWISYAFMNIALICHFIAGATKFLKSDMKTSVIIILGVYGIVEFITGIVFILFNPENIRWPLIVQLVMLCIAIVASLTYLSLDKS